MTPNIRFEKNENLILFVYHRGFAKYDSYKDDLLQEGAGALWKCCLNFDESKNIQFSTYACVSIRRAMKKFVDSQIIKHINDISIETIICDNGEKGIRLSECLTDSENPGIKDMVDECLKKMTLSEIEIIRHIFKGYKQREIAQKCNITQQSVSKILIKFKHLVLIESLKNKEVVTIMKYAKKQASDVLTLAYNYALKNSVEEKKIGCYIVKEGTWRTVLSKGFNSKNESALKNAMKRIHQSNNDKTNEYTLFITSADIDPKIIIQYGIKTIIYGGELMNCEISNSLESKQIEVIHISDWKPNENN